MAAKKKSVDVKDYRHDATRKNNPPAAIAGEGRLPEYPKQRYSYDPHLPPVLRFDESAGADRLPELLEASTTRPLTGDEVKILADALKNHEPWLEWTGKQEKRWFEVDPVALHTHERVSAQACIRAAARKDIEPRLFADPELDYNETVQFYRHDVDWANRMILGDSLTVMNSLATREDLAGKVQMIYMDPPYGIKFGSNFQPYVKRGPVRDRDEDVSRQPEIVKAYRDTWTLGLHSYLAYLSDRLTVARELLTDSGSLFMQIGEENVHRVRSVMDQVFGASNFVSMIAFRTSSGTTQQSAVKRVSDYILWYSKNSDAMKFNRILIPREVDTRTYNQIELKDGQRRPMTAGERRNPSGIPAGAKVYTKLPLHSMASGDNAPRKFFGRLWRIPPTSHWRYAPQGATRLYQCGRIAPDRDALRSLYFHDDYPAFEITATWNDTGPEVAKSFVVQTSKTPIQRCMLMTTAPGDLILDPTCGSGTTAVVAEQWGRRWITADTSRVAIALAKQRLLTSKFDYYETGDGTDRIGPSGLKSKTMPHITLGGIANNIALDPIFERWDPIMDGKLAVANQALNEVSDEQRAGLLAKLEQQTRLRTRGDRITDADERRWKLPAGKWEHWEVPFDTDDDYSDELQAAILDYRDAWRQRMTEVDACIAAAAEQEALVDQPEVRRGVVRVSGPFTVESVHPPEESLGMDSPIGGEPEVLQSFGDIDTAVDNGAMMNAEAGLDGMVKLLRDDGVRFQGNGAMRFSRLDPIRDGTILHAEGEWHNGHGDEPRRVAVSFGPQYGPVSAKQVEDSLRQASRLGFDELLFAGFAFDGAAQAVIQDDPNPNVRMHMAQISPDVNMGDLLKQTRNSQLFSVSGLPRTGLEVNADGDYIVELEGVDIYDPVENSVRSAMASDVAAWFLDCDYDGMTFCATQAFFPDPSAWSKLKAALKTTVDGDAFAAFSGTRSLPFTAGEHKRAAVKVIDPRGNEVMKLLDLEG